AYTTFPGGGKRPKSPYVIDRIVDGDGTEIFKTKVERVSVVADSTAYQVTAILEDALHLGTGVDAVNKYNLGKFAAAAKTGTAYNFTDTYTIGYTSAVTCGVWVGFDKPTKIFRGAFGNDLSLPVWTQVINTSAQKFQAQEFQRPASLIPVSICRKSGLLESGRCEEDVKDPQTGAVRKQKTSYIEYATAKNKPTIPCDIHGTGLRLYAPEREDSKWPRAETVVDLTMIRPVGISEPALVGFDDVYRSVKPATMRMDLDQIPVAKAEPVDKQVAEAALAIGERVEKAEPVTPDEAQADTQEVRKAEAVKPLDVPSAEEIPLDLPPPIQF
ncbi:MAG: penicillin-binding transpeptidase domain-containing protein, partial [Chthoniobacterales bacterium]